MVVFFLLNIIHSFFANEWMTLKVIHRQGELTLKWLCTQYCFIHLSNVYFKTKKRGLDWHKMTFAGQVSFSTLHIFGVQVLSDEEA